MLCSYCILVLAQKDRGSGGAAGAGAAEGEAAAQSRLVFQPLFIVYVCVCVSYADPILMMKKGNKISDSNKVE